MGRVVNAPPGLKVDPAEVVHSCSHRPMIAQRTEIRVHCQLGKSLSRLAAELAKR